MGLMGKTAVVTGAGTGFGAAIARGLAEAGARVMVCDANADAAEAVASEIGGLWAAADPAQNAALGAMAYKAPDQLGDIDIVVNAVLRAPLLKPLDEVSEAEFDAQLLAQTKPIYLTTRHFVPAMKARQSGVILTILGPAKTAVWTDAARHWAVQATKSMALDLAPHGIRVNALSVLADTSPVLPSFLGGKKNDDRARKLAAIPLGRFTLPDDLAQAAVFLCSDAASLITGMVLDIDGGAGL
jgi:3-oxoacyl-[acyl-carrier protein] reductase